MWGEMVRLERVLLSYVLPYVLSYVLSYVLLPYQAQKNYPTFDQESAAILFCVRKWHKIITCRPTTIYTDSSVAASMLYKHLGPPRLQRWGMELGTFLPFLKVAYRKGVDNGMADFLSRYPTFKNYVQEDDDATGMSEELFDLLPESVPLFTHKLGDDDAWLAQCRYPLYEAKNPAQIESIWQAQGVHSDGTGETADDAATGSSDDILLAASGLPSVAALFSGENGSLLADKLPAQIAKVRHMVEQGDFFREQREFEWQCRAWEIATETFEAVNGRAPILYDLCCGEGGYSRGARISGVRCYGFDTQAKFRRRYEGDATSTRGEYTSSGMTFLERDVTSEAFWEELVVNGRIGDCPPPDMIHVSPPCRGDSRLGKMSHPRADRDIDFDWMIRQLKRVEGARAETSSLPLLWQLENVPESESAVTEPVVSRGRLCGTMMGNRVFRHRVFYCNYECDDKLEHCHDGKLVGNRGVHYSTGGDFNRFSQLPEANMYGVYSQRSPGRGSLEEWHGALGHGANQFSAEGVLGALPLGYGRLLTAQMVSHYLHRTVDYPIISPHERTALDRLVLERWADGGHPGFELDSVASAFWFSDADLVANIAAGECHDAATPEPPINADAPNDDAMDDRYAAASPYEVRRDRQLRDPQLGLVLTRLESGNLSKRLRSALNRLWVIDNGLLYRLAIDTSGEPGRRLAVPDADRGPLMRRFHAECHRGGDPLFESVSEYYWWPEINRDCHDYANACTLCGGVRSRSLAKAPIVPIATPSRPFSVVHVDHKGPLPRSGAYTNILVVVCALTRFTLYIPVPNVTAMETQKALMTHVFSIFGFPLVMISDNGPAFRSDLQGHMADFFGFRHVPILPYNAAANGTAEASVKRIKLLLDRHTKGYAEWHRVLPLAQLQLNSHVHTGTDMSPYMALFGRAPHGIAQLENPSLLSKTGSGSEWLKTVRGMFVRVHADIQKASDDLKRAHADAANARTSSDLDPRAGQIKPGGWVRIVKGSLEEAKFLRKHGHGTPWKNRYRVLEVKPHAVRLSVPKDGSVPAIGDWQLIRRMEPSPAETHRPHLDDPRMTELGIPVPGTVGDVTVDVADPNQLYEIDKILRATKVGGKYILWVKWRGYQDPTPVPRAQLLQDTNNPALLIEIDEAVARYREEKRLADDDEDEPELDDSDDHEDPSEPELLTGRVPRVHRPPMRYNPSNSDALCCVLELSHDDFVYYDSELDTTLDCIVMELSELDYNLLW